MNKSVWQIDALGIIALSALAALLYVAVVRPQLDQRTKSQVDQRDCASAQQKLNEVEESLSTVRSQLAVTQRQRATLELPLQSAALLNHRLALITELASSAGATLDDIQPGKTTAGGQFDLVPIHISGSGSYAAFVAMLDDLHRRCPDSGVGAFTVNQPQGSTNGPGKFTVDISWYVERSETAGLGK